MIVFLENVTSRAWACLFRSEFIKLENAYILNLSYILAKVVYTPEFWDQNFLKCFTTKLQPHSLKVSSKKKSFSM